MRLLPMKVAAVAAVVLALSWGVTPATANIGDQWILQIHHLDNPGFFTPQPATGYAGAFSSGDPAFTGTSVLGNGNNGVARVYWELSGLSINNGRPVPTTAEQFTLEFYDPTDIGHNGFDPVESQFHGAGGEASGEGALEDEEERDHRDDAEEGCGAQ